MLNTLISLVPRAKTREKRLDFTATELDDHSQKNGIHVAHSAHLHNFHTGVQVGRSEVIGLSIHGAKSYQDNHVGTG